MLAFLFFLALSAVQPAEDPFVIDVPDSAPAAQQAAPVQATQASAAAPGAEPSEQRLICRSRPKLGSRIVTQRTCRTAEDWALYENDLEQSRRDINDRGARGCVIGQSCE